ncbi:MAG: PLDc N-terminal domain-containing protein [archaeon]
MAAEAAFGLLFIPLFLMFFVVAILFFILWIFMIIDVAKRKFPNENDKIIWILVIILAGWIGAIIYYFVIKSPEDKKSKKH